ncbi:MAG: hypothetical protein QOH91_3257 [Mycobacterium sp.]|jgi:hypothetical protein|nr:hypothetical protein [Mycobacterium sp.]
MRLAPLPIPTRVYRGENVDSYSRRHAARNHCAPSDVDRALREHGILITKARLHPVRLQAWRALGRLRATAFTTPERILDEEVTERALCRHCTRGERARGRLPELGMVCLRHRRWLGSPQVDLHGYHPALVAERQFRHHLAARNVLHDSLPMLIGRDCANPAIIGHNEIAHRRDRTSINDPWALTYPEQVKIARLLTRPTFLGIVTDPDVDETQRHTLATREVEKIIPARDDAHPWRATNRVWTATTHLTARRRDARIHGTPIRDTYYNILRLI